MPTKDLQAIAEQWRNEYQNEVSGIHYHSARLSAELVLRGLPVRLAIWRAYDRHTSNPRQAIGSHLDTRTTGQSVRPTSHQERLRHLLYNDTVPPSYQWIRLPHTARGEQASGRPSARGKHRSALRTDRVVHAIDSLVDKIAKDCHELRKLYILRDSSKGKRKHAIRSQVRAVENRINFLLGNKAESDTNNKGE